ncbi:TlpA family protein disulfide reductase [Salinimicrobium xinjiangense]|uniref:TlpA family protein disulfide reductase n=1 Tax=Salinimicrobium xinjiangense TaxID=438596 RepID=UPI0005699021|nr:TlpA disulfide reductase family protein [Salinimicrobium xinjiangense]
MKKLMILVLGLCLSCADNGKGKGPETASQEIESQIVQQKESTSSAFIPTVNFEEFNTKYLQQKNDTTYIINFWATWCKPCVKELPVFEKVNEQYKDRKVKVVLASLDFPDKLQNQVIPFVKKFDLQSKVVLLDDPDANSWIPKVSEEWSGAIPATIIYNSKELRFFEGSFTYEELNKELTTIL